MTIQGKWTHADVQGALTWKSEDSRGVASGTRVKQESTKWSQKQEECVEFVKESENIRVHILICDKAQGSTHWNPGQPN